MERKTIIAELIKTANALDEVEMHDDANQITGICARLAQLEIMGDEEPIEDFDPPYCGGCGEHCSVKPIDAGIGNYEFWGAPGNDRDIRFVSDCCEADIYDDPALTKKANGEDYYSEPEPQDFMDF